jgi:immune inhibitor A
VSINVYTLRAPNWEGVARTARSAGLGLLLMGVLALPFGVGAVVNHAREAGPVLYALDGAIDAGATDLGVAASGATTASPADAPIVGPVATGAVAQQDAAADQLETLERLLATVRPPRDPVALASRLAGTAIPWTATQPFVGPLEVGRRDSFYVLDQTDNTYKERPAVLRLVSEHAYWYVQESESLDDGDLATAAQHFEEQTIPTVHRVFGSEWLPGIDGDARVTVFLGNVPGVAAYFSSWDEYPRTVYRFSNEREMLHVNLGATRPGSSGFDGTLAHEFQHMVHWHVHSHDDTWLDEGFAEVASLLSTSGRGPGTGTLQRQPDVQLTAWSQGGGTGVHYQASYLFSHYLAQRFGEAALGQILQESGRPPDTITAYLSRTGQGVTFDDVFEDWLVANLLDDPSVGDGRYANQGIDHRAIPALELKPDGQPAEQTVHQYGAQYVEFKGDGGDADLAFEGAPSVRLVGADPTSGRALWWSNRADGMDTSLTRSFDLTGVPSATLRFNLWYDTERDFDFFYVLASTDGGTTWQVLRGANASDANPTGNAVGPGYSGRSGVTSGQRADPAWINESVDLTPFAGKPVLVRFEYVTDQGYNAGGVALDDLAISEIGFQDDAEADDGWAAEGFLRSENVIPQTWSLQLVEKHRDGQTTVRPLRADGAGQVTERIASLGGDVERAVLVVSGLAPRTLETAPYRLTLRPVQ